MPSNDFLPFGTDPAANVMSQGAYSALTQRPTGFVAGLAQSLQLNKVWRQATVMAAAIGDLILTYGGLDALDDGNIANLRDNFARTMRDNGLSYIVATGTANAWVLTPTPTLAAYVAGQKLWVVPPATNTSTTVNANVSGLGNKLIKRGNGTDPAVGDLLGGRPYPVVYDGTSFRVIISLPSDYSPAAKELFFTASGTLIVPASTILVEGTGGGGGGGASANGSGGGIAGNMGGGGGGAGYFRKIITGLTIGSSVAITIGAGGAAPSAGPGGVGGNTSVGAICTANGGGGGSWGENTVAAGGTGGAASGGDINIQGGYGGFSGPNAGSPTVSDILRVYGRGGQAAGGLSLVDLASTGAAGRGFGSGGSGASGGSGLAGGAGAPGYVFVRY